MKEGAQKKSIPEKKIQKAGTSQRGISTRKQTNYKMIVITVDLKKTYLKLEPLRGGSLLFTTKFPVIFGTHFTDLGEVKG